MSMPGLPPLTPTGGAARRWLVDELSHPAYQAARPNWFDEVADRLRAWFVQVFLGTSVHAEPILLALGLVIAVAVIVGAFVLFGRPRRAHRRVGARREALFGVEDIRSADRLREDAAAAAAHGDWQAAVCDLFRAIAVQAEEDGLVVLTPGTTATGLARRMAAALPDLRDAVAAGARLFERVRYASAAAGPKDHAAMLALASDLQAARRRRRATV